MEATRTSSGKSIKPFSVRRNVDRKILRFSLWIGAIASALMPLVFFVRAYPLLKYEQEINHRTLSEISCTNSGCNTSVLTTDWRETADYALDQQTRYFFNESEHTAENPSRFGPLDSSDTKFISNFRQPNTYKTPDGETWRLYSRGASWGGRRVEILVGYAETAPWKMLDTSASQIPVVDGKLQKEADQIADDLPSAVGSSSRAFTQRLSADGVEIADASTGKVLLLGPPIPMFLPNDEPLPKAGRQLYMTEGQLYIIQTDVDGRLLATSLVEVGSIWWITATAGIAFFGITALARGLSRRFLRNYFAVTGMRVPSLDEALRHGEGQNVEFKRGISEDQATPSRSEDELLKSIAAFANTNDGAVFIGVDDSGKIQGLKLNFSQRDRLEQKIRQLIRNRIKPIPPTHIAFTDVRGLVVAKIAVPRGDAQVYLLNGTIYVRDGSSDVQAQPEHLNRLFAA